MAMKTFFSYFAWSESGATAIEYGLIAAGMAITLAVVMPSITGGVTAAFSDVANALAR
jgi:pilus assembly protein Flp/PilA